MKQRKQAKWKATPREPLIVLVVDEMKFLASRNKQILKDLENLAAIGRKYGFVLIFATQYPKKEYIGGTWEQMTYKVSSRLQNEVETGVVFGGKAALAPCHTITAKGVFYAEGDNGKIERIRMPYLPEEVIVDMAEKTAKYRDIELSRRFSGAGRFGGNSGADKGGKKERVRKRF